ncbi:MAG TPA: LytTR family DNA-binding domain-containing protein [Niabella sp.]|jgi:DNA-binding LytR/AlgR family response regulator|nr:LytTR family DNA-binding domain-containing protein [Chitinophagaceae bacterium]HRN47387.1 LytTR family DNA-binding domain-containing protein [Niabella sp.]HRO84332.1 LytTR family DNA-binding domain-containing protein [Niabella sp.]HUN01741.1 LytTR family DNA-binding domain-containing protein [Niabella sp.]
MKENRPPICLIVDDNKVAIVLLRQLLEKIGAITVAGECNDAIEAKEFIENNAIDILFLDVEMPGISGIELLKLIPQEKRPLTILTTAKKGYAVEAFELNVVDYLVKPFTLTRLMASIDRAKELLEAKEIQLNNETPNNILFIRDNKIIRKVDIDDILWLEAKGDYVKIQTDNNSYVIHTSLKILEEKLPAEKFFRVHRSFLIALNKIDYIEDRVLYIHKNPIPVSESNKEALLKNMGVL